MSPIATVPYAAALALLYTVLTVHIVLLRRRFGAPLGDKGEAPLTRAIRAHGNFAEFVPFLLLLIVLHALCGGAALLTHFMGILLVVGRLLHAYSLLVHEPGGRGLLLRILGMVCTFTVLITAAVALGMIGATSL